MNTELKDEPQAIEHDCDRSRAEIIKLITELIVDSRIALLTSCGADHVIRSCPMLNVNQQFDGDLFFITKSEDKLVDRFRENPIANVSLPGPNQERFASICGKASILDDAKKLELMWTDDCKKFFGLEKPNREFTIIKIDVSEAEYWDQNQSLASRFKRLVRRITGGEPNASSTCHEKVDWVEESIHDEQPSTERLRQSASVVGG